MRSSKELTNTFFSDLKRYNESNFKTIERADLSKQDAIVHKAFSSVLTRYFIFKEKHPEVSEVENKMLYFKLKLDMIATYFSEYPETTTNNLVAFQLELKKYVQENNKRLEEAKRQSKNKNIEEGSSNEQNSQVQDIGLVADN